MIESGIITKDVEQFVCINLKVDAAEAIDLESSLEELIVSGVLKMLPHDGQTSLLKLHEVLGASLTSYAKEYDDNEQFIGNADEES